MHPTIGPCSQEYGQNAHFSWQPWGHLGRDYAVAVGTSVVSIGSGVVMFADWSTKMSAAMAALYMQVYGSPASGIVVFVAHEGAERGDPRGWFSMHCHLSSTHLNAGDRVVRGQAVGKSGNTGNSTGPHVHYEVFMLKDGRYPVQAAPFGRYDPRLQIQAQDAEAAAQVPTTTPMQRVVVVGGVNEFDQPSTKGKVTRTFAAGAVLNFKGYVLGERVDDMNGWFVGATSGRYFHVGRFAQRDVKGLPNLTPQPVNPGLRMTGAAAVVHRDFPLLSANRRPDLKPNTGYTFNAYCDDGEAWNGSRVWFRSTSGGWSHSKLFTSQSLTGLTKVPAPRPAVVAPVVTPKPPAPTPVPKPETSAGGATKVFEKSLPIVTKVVPAAPGNYGKGGFPVKPTHLVIHQIDELAKRPSNLAGVDSWFTTDRSDRTKYPAGPTSAQFACVAPDFHQYVPDGDRAWHSGAVGNDYIALEVPPNPDEATIEMVKEYQRQYHAKHGYWLILIDHRSVPQNATSCGVNIPLARFRVEPAPVVVKPPVPATIADAAILAAFVEYTHTTIPAFLKDRK